MRGKASLLALAALLVVLGPSCTRPVKYDLANPKIERTSMGAPKPEGVSRVIFPSGHSIEFDHASGRTDLTARTVEGLVEIKELDRARSVKEAGRMTFEVVGGGAAAPTPSLYSPYRPALLVRVPLDSLLYLEVRRFDALGTAALTVAVLAVVAGATIGMIALLKESCPFIYSWDGERYELDAEPLGGAICAGLQRADLTRMEKLREIDGSYRVMIRNEVEETQHLDCLRLRVCDIPEGVEPVPGPENRLFLVRSSEPCAAAWDGEKQDLGLFLRERDGISWQSRMPFRADGPAPPRRHEITVRFHRPPGAQEGLLLYTAGSSLWGSRMIRETLALGGSALGIWYAAINEHGDRYRQFMAWRAREEIWDLRVMIRARDSWEPRGTLTAAGPLVHEERALPLDLSGVDGDTVEVRLSPPFGFWVIDHLAMSWDYGAAGSGEDDPCRVHEAPLRTVRQEDGSDIAGLLREEDGDAYVMPHVGDRAYASFDEPVPAPGPGMRRIFFLETTGWYEIHLPADGPLLVDRLGRLATPGGVIDLSNETYLQWLRDYSAAEGR